MTSPSDPRVTPQAPPAPVPDEAVVATAKKLVRVRSAVKTSFTRFGAPVATGVVTGLIVARSAVRRSQDSDLETDVVIDPTE